MRSSDSNAGEAIDAAMERASRALVAAQYFQAEHLALAALRDARAADDFDRMARIVLPLQEARRQIRDAALETGLCFLISRPQDIPRPMPAGCYLVQPPMIGAEGRSLHEQARRRGVPALVLTREPMTRALEWPMVAVGEDRSYRVKVAPPVGVQRTDESPRYDDLRGPPDSVWFAAAAEALGDSAIAEVDPGEPAAFRVDDLLERLEAHPDHEKLHQALESACREADLSPAPTVTRHRPLVDDPFSF